MRLIDALFNKSAQSIKDSVPSDMAEVAFLGRSNVGKSSLLNSLTNKKKLALSSQTPGKTKLINFFDITYQNKEKENFFCRFVDLPGFGYAKVSKSLKYDWQEKLTDFLFKRYSIRVFIHLIDSRHRSLDIDKEVAIFINKFKKPDQIVVNCWTKIDKLKKMELVKLKQQHPDGIFVSNLNKQGVDDLNNLITKFLFKERIYQ